MSFDEKEIKKISVKINSFKPTYVWVGIGNPKQEILASQLFEKTKAAYFFNVGAAIDFILGKKKESPPFFSKIGLEWLYRLITDFKYSRKKVLKSFFGLFYLLNVKLK